jgi:hypothetical protein
MQAAPANTNQGFPNSKVAQKVAQKIRPVLHVKNGQPLILCELQATERAQRQSQRINFGPG